MAKLQQLSITYAGITGSFELKQFEPEKIESWRNKWTKALLKGVKLQNDLFLPFFCRFLRTVPLSRGLSLTYCMHAYRQNNV